MRQMKMETLHIETYVSKAAGMGKFIVITPILKKEWSQIRTSP